MSGAQLQKFNSTFSPGFVVLVVWEVESDAPEQALSRRADRANGTREPRSMRRMTSSSEATASSLKRAPGDRSDERRCVGPVTPCTPTRSRVNARVYHD